MIIEELVLHDFGIYQGRHQIDLTPVSDDKPIILFGARNGRGKTTFLDAVNLVLFGSRARLSNRRPNTSWDKYLRESINRRAAGGALVSMRFTVEDDFDTRVYEITRSWEVSGKSVKEFFDVRVNGEPDRLLSEDWDDHIEGLLPLEVASLNFFDGEKIDQLADPAKSRGVIESAIRGLLGLGVLERLQADLKVLLRRKQDEAIGEEATEELVGLEAEIAELTSRLKRVTAERDATRDQLGAARSLVETQEKRARSLGADKWEQRVELETRSRDLSNERAAIESGLQALAEGAVPMRLVRGLLERTRRQVSDDGDVHTSRLLLAELESRDKAVLEALPTEHRGVVDEVLRADRNGRSAAAARETVHADTERLLPLVDAALRDALAIDDVSASLSSLDEIDARLHDTEKFLVAVPTEAQLAPVLEELGRARAVVEGLEAQVEEMDTEIAHIEATLSRQEVQFSRLREAEADKQKDQIEGQRTREYINRALATIEELSRSTIERNLATIEVAILDRFHQLIGKKSLVTAVVIDRETLELTVSTGSGAPVPVERLSAGERQLLATATLWGLSTVAGRSIPLVVDTPLGRLDGDHRLNLATNYYPYASRQVIILSTDEEFHPELVRHTEHAIGRKYLIEFVEEDESSSIREGYFEGAIRGN